MPSNIFEVVLRDIHTHQEFSEFVDAQTPEMAENRAIELHGLYNVDVLEVERL